MGLRTLHPHQSLALQLLKDSLRAGKRRPLVMSPTGSGKTVLSAHIVAGALAKGNRVAFIVPTINLIDQTFARFIENGIDPADMGVIQADHEWRRPHAPLQICSVQTLARRGMPEASVLVIDEAHIRDAKLHAYLSSDEGRSAVAIGLSATPFAKGLGRVFDDLICPVTMRELIDGGYLSKFRVFAPTHPDLSAVKIDAKSGDYQTGELSDCMSKPHLVADVIATWLEKGENRPTLCFAVDRAHAAVLHEQFEANGVSSAYVDANTPREDRLDLAKRFSRGEIKVICNIGTMTTGVDLDVRCIIFARPTKSESLFVQCLDGDTEILGKNGWLKRGDVSQGDEIAAFDTLTGTVLWQRAEGVIDRQIGAGEKMVGVSSPHLDFRITGNHRMVLSSRGVAHRRGKTNWKFEEALNASNRKDNIVIPVAGNIVASGVAITDAELSFLGWFLSDGTLNKATNSLSISQSVESEQVAHIRRTLDLCGFRYGEYTAKRDNGYADSIRFNVSYGDARVDNGTGTNGWNRLERFINSDKVITSSYDDLTREQLLVLLDAMNRGDGCKFTHHSINWVPKTMTIAMGCHRHTADRIQALCVTRGIRCNMADGGTKKIRLHININKTNATIRGARVDDENKNARIDDRSAMPGEMVWCVSVQTGAIIIRRNGKVSITGNCIGRGLRTAPDKQDCLIFDHSDTHLRLGMVTDISIDELDTGKPGAGDAKKKEKLDPLPKECSRCQCLVPAMVDECPNCGHVFKRVSSVVQEDGELVELGAKKRNGKSKTATERLAAIPRSELFGQIRQVQKDRKWSDGRAAHVYRDITSCWPNNVKMAALREPSPELLSFIRHKDMAFAKGRAKSKGMTMGALHG